MVKKALSKIIELLEILSENICGKEVVESLRSTYQSEFNIKLH